MDGGGLTGRKLSPVDWVGVVVCVVLGISTSEVVGRQVHLVLDFWPAFGIKVAAGGAVAVVLLSVWLGVIRRSTRSE